MKNLLVNHPFYEFDVGFGMGHDYSMALMKISTFLKKQGETVDMFDFFPYKDFFPPDTFENLGNVGEFCDKYSFKDAHKLKSFKEQVIGKGRFELSRETGRFLSRFGMMFRERYLGEDMDLFASYIDKYRPDRVWISIPITHHYRGAFDLIKTCKKVVPGVEIIIGGTYPTLCNEHAREKSGADVVVNGYDYRFHNEDLDYDVLPNPPQYLSEYISYGCPNSCNFCAVRKLEGSKVTFVDIKDSCTRIRNLSEKYKEKKIKIWGPNPMLHRGGKSMVEWLDAIIGMDLGLSIYFQSGVAPELLTTDMCKKMKQAGFIEIRVPMEAGNDNSLCGMNKEFKVKQWRDAVNIAIDSGFDRDNIKTHGIVGTPSQTEKDISDMMSLGSEFGIGVAYFLYTAVPGSNWYESNEYLKSLDLELMNGILLPAVKDPNLALYIYENIKKMKLERLTGMESKKNEVTSGSDPMIYKMAQLLIDISEQNEEILCKLGSSNIMERIKILEEKVGINGEC